MVDILATMTPQEYRTVKAELTAQGLWHGGNGTPAQERRSNAAAEKVIKSLRN